MASIFIVFVVGYYRGRRSFNRPSWTSVKLEKKKKATFFRLFMKIANKIYTKKDYQMANIITVRYQLCLLVSFLFEPSNNCRSDPRHSSPTVTSSSCYDEQILPFVPSSRQLWRKNTCPINIHFLNTYYATYMYMKKHNYTV